MKEIIIKTCHGYERLRFMDGALVPSDGLPCGEWIGKAKLQGWKFERVITVPQEVLRQAWLQRVAPTGK